MKKSTQVDEILRMASEGLAERAKKAVETKATDKVASGHIGFLIKKLAELFLTKKQQEEIKAILDFYDRCLFPLVFASPEQRQLCPFCPEEDQHDIGNGFFGEPCQIDGVPCCETCMTVNDL